MIACQPAHREQYEQFMDLMMQEGDDLREALRLMEITESEFDPLFRTVGRVYCVYADSQLAGFYWVEERGKILHLHGLILKTQFQGRGVGSQILDKLTAVHKDSVNAIELGVHESNMRAIKVYERNGFETVKKLDELQFRIMQKQFR
jgi:ribosomal protein S18 acetylase RimI-like enzyme